VSAKAVYSVVASRACGNQIPCNVIPTTAARFDVVHMEAASAATKLASPPVAPQNLLTEVPVLQGIKSDTEPASTHCEALSAHAMNCSCCGGLRKPYRWHKDVNSASGSPPFRLAPAKKSAQIISKQ
jgi:hypothetical protein